MNKITTTSILYIVESTRIKFLRDLKLIETMYNIFEEFRNQ